MTALYGKFRGTVVTNVDPLRLGRLLVNVPSVMGLTGTNWATPCVPYAGPGVGFHMLPPMGASVWVEFEQGDPNKPIWVGCFWEPFQMPLAALLPTQRLIKTEGCTLMLDDTPGVGGVKLEVGPPIIPLPAKLTLGADGANLVYVGCSVRVGAKSVKVNHTALEVLTTGVPG
jgi:hypothetical protein